LRATLLLKVTCRNSVIAKRLSSVLAPDNRSFPSDQRFSMAVRSRSVLFRVESERAPAAFTTVHGILSDVVLFQEIWLISRTTTAKGEKIPFARRQAAER